MSDDITAMMEADFEDSLSNSVEKVDQTGLQTVASLARSIREKEEQIDDLETQLKAAKQSLLKLTDEDLPALLAEMGMTGFKLEDGSMVEVKQTYGASIRVADRPAAYQWLRDHGYDDIIKNTVSVAFGRGEDDKARDFTEVAQKSGFLPEQKEEIHTSTLRAFIKERVESGDEFPMDLFGAWIGQRAVIKKGK